VNRVNEKLATTFNPHSHTILIVDDEPTNLTVVVEYLAAYGFQVKVARTGEAGLELARQAPPDLILLDVVLPGIDGFEVCRRLKADTQTEDLPIIFMTIMTRLEDKVQGFEVGGVDYITKPFQREEVLARVTTHLRLRDLTEHLEQQVHKRTEELRKVTQAYKALSACNQTVMRATEGGELLQEVCRIIVSECGYRLVWIGFAEHDQARTVRPVAQAGYEAGYLETINLTWADTERGLGPTGTAIRTKKPVINREVLTNPDFAPWRAEAIKRGYASSAALPLFTGEQEALGALNVYAAEPDAFTPEEVTLLLELAGDLAYGLESLRVRAANARAEEALRKSETLLNATQRLSKVGGWEFDVASGQSFWTAETYRIHEMLRDAVLDHVQESLKCYRPEDRLSISGAFQRAIEQGEAYDLEFPFTTFKGKSLWVRTTAQPIVDEGGRVVRVIGNIMDITERKRAEESLRESESRLRTLMDHIPAEVWAMNKSLHFTLQNAASVRVVGHVVGQRLEDLALPAEVKTRFMEQDQQVLDGKTLHEEYQIAVAGKPVVYENIVAPIKVDDAIVGLVGISLDVTERRRAEEALSLNAERAMTLLKLNQMTGATPKDLMAFAFEEAVRLTRSKIGYLAFLNADETVLTMQVWSRGAMAECAIADKPIVYPVETTGLWGEAVRQRRPMITNDYAAPNPWKKGRPEGHVHIVRHMNTPIMVDGKIVLVAGVGNKEDDYDETDVHQLTLLMEGMWRLIERKRAEEELQNHRDHLEELVKQRTAELAEARDRAEAADRAKSAFLTNISHELRTPLNGILGYADILKRRVGYTGSLVDGLDIIQRSGEHLLTLINDLLDLAKIEAGKLELTPVPFHLPTFLRQITDIVRARAEDKGLSLTYESLSPLPEAVLADATRLRQVLLNLLDNAVKFTDRGSVTLRITGRQQTVDSRQEESATASGLPSTVYHLHFEVEDTGQGIPADQWERIFLPFEQAGEGGKRVEGTGLGLAISRQIVELMGGQLQVQSPAFTPPAIPPTGAEVRGGPGSHFWFDVALPVVEVNAAFQPTVVRRIIGYEGARRKVLVVDDKPYNRLLLVDILEPLGFEVCTAGDGQDAVDQTLLLRPDAIVMDLIMPLKTGIEAIQAIRQNPLLREVVIIAVSASVLEAAGKECLVAGCDEFLTKPIHAERLLEALAARLQLTWRYAETSAPDEDASALVTPPRQDLVTLYALAQQGRIWDIRDCATRLLQQDTRYRPFVEAVHALAREFKSEQIKAFIQPFIKE